MSPPPGHHIPIAVHRPNRSDLDIGTGLYRLSKAMLHNHFTFVSSLPDDSVEEGGNGVVPAAGRNIMDSLARCLRDSGHHVSEITQHSFYGWSFETQGPEGRFWHMLQHPDPWLLMVEDRRALHRRLFQRETPFERALANCEAALRGLEHVSEAVWFTRADYARSSRRHAQVR